MPTLELLAERDALRLENAALHDKLNWLQDALMLASKEQVILRAQNAALEAENKRLREAGSMMSIVLMAMDGGGIIKESALAAWRAAAKGE